MIFVQGLVTYNDFSDCHDKFSLHASILLADDQFCGHYLQREGVLLGTPNEDSYIGSSISSLMAVERKSRIGGNESASYFVFNDVTVDILSSMQICFGLVLER